MKYSTQDLYSFELPQRLIAQQPAHPRDTARLLVVHRQTGKIIDDHFYNIGKHLHPSTTIFANNSRVEHCRYLFDNGKKELFVVEKLNDKTIRAMVRPGKAFKVGSHAELDDGVVATVEAIDDNGLRTITFNCTLDDHRLLSASHVPLPPYIAQDDSLEAEYQTIYAKTNGSLAAPTAGLHFTESLKEDITRHFGWQELTLHVGLGTFASLQDENFKTGKLHSEKYSMSQEVYEALMAAKHVTAIGTTTARTIETIAAQPSPKLEGSTDIFITPAHTMKRVDSLVTNFHLPSTSLLLLVETMLGSRELLEKCYTHAIKNEYRFYSFGDAMLIV